MRDFSVFVAAAGMSVAFGLSGVTTASAQLLGGITDAVSSTVSSVTGGLSSGEVGVSGLATVNLNSNSGGTTGNGTVLGGGGNSINVPLGGLLGGDSGLNASLPGFGLTGNQPGTPGAPGTPGINGSNGGSGASGINGSSGRNGLNGITGSRIKSLLRILENRAWLRFAKGNAVCLPAFGVANVAGWIKPSEYGQMERVIGAYGNDIGNLQRMMKKCRNGQNRMVDLSRVIGVDIRKNGQVVVMTI